MITFHFAMRAQGWAPFPLFCPTADCFLEAGGISLEILIFVGNLFYCLHQFLVSDGKLGVVGK